MRNSILLSRRRRSLILNALTVTTLILIVACSGGESTPDVAPASTSIPDVAQDPAPAPTPVATELQRIEPTAVPTPASAPVTASTPAPTATPTPLPTSTPVVSNVFDGFGFTLQLDQDANFGSSDLLVKGWTESEASNDQGLLTFTYTGADVVFFWKPQNNDVPQTVVDSTYELQKLSQPDVNFTPINEGDLTVDGEAGKFGGFVTADSSGGSVNGGLIGAWTCQQSGTSFSLTTLSPDSTALQIRFDRLISGFQCTA